MWYQDAPAWIERLSNGGIRLTGLDKASGDIRTVFETDQPITTFGAGGDAFFYVDSLYSRSVSILSLPRPEPDHRGVDCSGLQAVSYTHLTLPTTPSV